jgi:hypothetical protein
MDDYQFTWYDKYLNKNDDYDDKLIHELINKLNNNNQKTVQNKVIQLETEYQIKLKEIEELCTNDEKIDKIKKENSLKIIQKELDVIKLLTKYSLQNNQLNYTFFINSLNLLFNLSEALRIRLGQKEINIEKKNYSDDNISRCSYKFCNFKDTCNYNYNKSKNMCYQDHYVHNMVSADLKILIEYIEQKYGNTKVVLHNKEILKTINTLSYVINHMENELKTKCLYLSENEIESYHFIKLKNVYN